MPISQSAFARQRADAKSAPYQLAQADDKTAIFENWCDFLNYFDASVSVQLSFINQGTQRGEAEKAVNIPAQDDAFNSIRSEYGDMLQNQLAKGNNGLVKAKYITFAIEADSLGAAKSRLARIETDVLNNFKLLGVSARPMTGYLAANQPLNNHKNDHAAAIHAAAARDDCMDGAALLPDCTGTKEEYFYKESKTMKAKKLLSLLLVVAMLMSVLCMSVSASGSYDAISIGEGEPVKISWSGTTGTVISVNDSTFIPKQFLLWARNEYTIKVDGTALTALDAGDNDSAYRRFSAVQAA